MRRIVFYCVLVPLAIVAIILSVANRHLVTVSFDPFNTTAPALSFSIPLFVLLFVVLVLGILIGGLAVWFGQGRWRRRARDEKATVDKLRREIDTRPPPAGPALPATGN
jgi:uncharacterized integral membrane protein